ncbi:uncharacterized protein LOC126901372 isoform X4 [Daktulosphaira vitifoliae]|uniref:uncharacterized protein LOC126901372 isoform X4 n=1 Tax=Daktulosphaira vitifoliae TaxID=58002 RepID=UPI0021AA57E6|nr:uncharacterized protein LOC126901372 isoform X4 [Daktulosphaira vitifoliae]
MKLFFLVFSTTILFMVIHNDHYMSMSKALSHRYKPRDSSTSNLCDECNCDIAEKKLFNCHHKYCIYCIENIRKSAYNGEEYLCKLKWKKSSLNKDICMSKLIRGNCLNCNEVKPVDNLFECHHTFCEDCIKYIKKEKTHYCPIDDCKKKVLLEKCDKCKYYNPVEKLFDCHHEYCKRCIKTIRQDAYYSKIERCEKDSCKSTLPKGNCLNCNEVKPVDNLFECHHTFCKGCIKLLINSYTKICPIDECKQRVLVEICGGCGKDFLNTSFCLLVSKLIIVKIVLKMQKK